MKRLWIATVGSVLLAALVVLLLACYASTPAQSNAAENRDGPVLVAPPHCGGEQASLSAALADASYSVILPEDGPASTKDLHGVWDCPGSATLIEFSSGVHLALDRNTIVDPEASWETLAESNPKIYSVGTVLGASALLIDPDGDPNDDANGGVTLVKDGVYVSLAGDGTIPLDTLIDAANSLQVSSKTG